MINTHWQKQAAQILDEKEVERAFMDQAYTFVANKAGPLMEDAHRLGFEVVYSDEDHTRMVGIFAFRVNRELLYVPVFFLNGQIRGTDLLYCHDTKMFRPLNKDWATYIVEKQKDQMGEGISQFDSRETPMDIELDDIAFPPATYQYKTASEVTDMFEKLANSFSKSMDKDVKKLIKKYINKKHTTDNKKPEDADCVCAEDKREEKPKKIETEEEVDDGVNKEASILRKFILEDGKHEATEKIASWIQSNKRFAELLVSNVPIENFMPSDLIEITKQAAAERNTMPSLGLYVGGVDALKQQPIADMEKSATAQEEFFSKGYYLWDDRAPSDLNPTTKDLEIELCKPGEPGVYKILCADGSLKEAIIAAPSEQEFRADGNTSYTSHSDAWACTQCGDDQPRELVVCMKDGEGTGTTRRLHGQFVKTLSDAIRDEELDTEMSSGKTYRVYDAEAGVLSNPIYCIGKRTVDGIETYTVAKHGWSPKFEIRKNDDFDNTSFSGNFLGKHTFFIPVAMEKAPKTQTYDRGMEYHFCCKDLPQIGDKQTLTEWILQHGVKQASVLRDPLDKTQFSLRAGPRKQTNYMPRPKLAAKMARDLGIAAGEVEYFLDKAASEGSVDFYVGAPSITKFAAPIDVIDQADFREDYDSEFNTPLNYPQFFALDTDTSGPTPPAQRVGDAYDPGMGMKAEDGQSLSSEIVLQAPAEQLEQLKEQAGVPNVFEHGLVGSLIHTYDSVAMIDKYIPDLESALDRLGRLLFLYYWKPRDFEDAYGADDMANLENQLLSTFQSFGELVLELLKKSQNRKGSSGNVSMYHA